MKPGTKVKTPAGECAVVVHSWINEQDITDCYVAAFKLNKCPCCTGENSKPFILRYYAKSLKILDVIEKWKAKTQDTKIARLKEIGILDEEGNLAEKYK